MNDLWHVIGGFIFAGVAILVYLLTDIEKNRKARLAQTAIGAAFWSNYIWELFIDQFHWPRNIWKALGAHRPDLIDPLCGLIGGLFALALFGILTRSNPFNWSD